MPCDTADCSWRRLVLSVVSSEGNHAENSSQVVHWTEQRRWQWIRGRDDAWITV